MSDYTKKVEEDAARAKALVEKLTASEGQPVLGERMPSREFHMAQGLAFTFVKKLGIGLTFESGHGFVVAKIKTPEGTIGWSAPLFISIKAGGAGLTLGYSEVDSVMVLDTPEATARFTKPLTDWGTDAAAAGPLGKVAGAASLRDSEFGDVSFSYSTAKGAIVDFSYQGLRYTVDAAKNKGAYGEGVTPEAILSGSVEAPASLAPLFEVLTSLAQK